MPRSPHSAIPGRDVAPASGATRVSDRQGLCSPATALTEPPRRRSGLGLELVLGKAAPSNRIPRLRCVTRPPGPMTAYNRYLCDVCAVAPPLTPHTDCSLTRSVDPFTKKDWYDVKAPSMFAQRQVGKTLVTRTQGTKVSPHGAPAWRHTTHLAPLVRRGGDWGAVSASPLLNYTIIRDGRGIAGDAGACGRRDGHLSVRPPLQPPTPIPPPPFFRRSPPTGSRAVCSRRPSLTSRT